MDVMAIPKFERFFRQTGDLDVDKNDLKRYSDFVFNEIYDMLIIAQAHAKANIRDVLEPWDIPIGKGLQENIHDFREIDHEIELEPILDHLAARPQLDVTLSDETRDELPPLAGGISVALARAMPIIDSEVKNPSSEHWERSFRLFNLLY